MPDTMLTRCKAAFPGLDWVRETSVNDGLVKLVGYMPDDMPAMTFDSDTCWLELPDYGSTVNVFNDTPEQQRADLVRLRDTLTLALGDKADVEAAYLEGFEDGHNYDGSGWDEGDTDHWAAEGWRRSEAKRGGL